MGDALGGDSRRGFLCRLCVSVAVLFLGRSLQSVGATRLHGSGAADGDVTFLKVGQQLPIRSRLRGARIFRNGCPLRFSGLVFPFEIQ